MRRVRAVTFIIIFALNVYAPLEAVGGYAHIVSRLSGYFVFFIHSVSSRILLFEEREERVLDQRALGDLLIKTMWAYGSEESTYDAASITDRVAELLDREVSPMHRLYSDTLLHAAAQHCPVSVAQLLVVRGADLYDCNFVRRTPLGEAVEHNNIGGVLFFMDQGMDVHANEGDGESLFDRASENMKKAIRERQRKINAQWHSATFSLQRKFREHGHSVPELEEMILASAFPQEVMRRARIRGVRIRDAG